MTPKSLTRVVHTEKRVDYVPVTGDVVAYRLTTTTTSGRRTPKVTVSEGLTSTGGLSAFQDGAAAMPPYRKDRAIMLGTPEFRELLRRHGWIDNQKLYEGFREVTDPYARFLAGTAVPGDLLVVDGSANMVFDVEGQPLPVAILFNYIEAQMDNRSYDLKKALAILKARPDVRFVLQDRWGAADEVQSIPGYNQSKGRTSCLTFVWMPSVEDYRRMWARCQEYEGRSHPSCSRYQAVFDLDLLGLRAGGAARFGSFAGAYEEPDEAPDEDGCEEDD